MVEQSKLSADYTSRDLVPVASAVHVVLGTILALKLKKVK